ncbi:MAG: T9SS type A sorting domain-containing protein [Bacteroidota bacterium]
MKNFIFPLALCLLLFQSSSLGAQPLPPNVYSVDLSNLSTTVASIIQTYGSQINLSSSAIESFISTYLVNTSGACPAPVPQIDQQGGGTGSLSWNPNPAATAYGVYYLNLGSGTNGSYLGTGLNYQFSGQGLYLVGVYSSCLFGENRPNSPSNIVIMDIDILLPTGGGGNGFADCSCANPASTILYDGGKDEHNFHFWTGSCNQRKYKLKVQGTLQGNTPYTSELSFSYRKDLSQVILNPGCDNNAMSQITPFHIGSTLPENYYRLNFTVDKVKVDFAVNSNFSPSLVQLQSCVCDDQLDGFSPRRAPTPSFAVRPNPSDGRLELVGSEAIQHLTVYDAQGRLVFQTERPQRWLDLHHLPNGLYTLIGQGPKGQKSERIVITR